MAAPTGCVFKTKHAFFILAGSFMLSAGALMYLITITNTDEFDEVVSRENNAFGEIFVKELDFNHDGVVTLDDIRQKYGETDESSLKQFRFLDKNKDGKITVQEAAVAQNPPKL